MHLVAHRINTIQELNQIPSDYGTEIDIRALGSHLILNHEAFQGGDQLVDYLDAYCHQLLILNIKEAGIETEVLRLVRDRGIQNFFLLDVEFPYIYNASRKGERAIAMRYSEDEPIELVMKYHGKVDWVWIDTNTILPLNEVIIAKLQGFKTCLVCPGRWGRQYDISVYREKMKKIDFYPDAVMTSLTDISKWEN